MTNFVVRKADLADVDDMLRIQRSSYSDELIEDKKIFEAILKCSSSYVAALNDGEGEVVAYLLTHGIEDISVPPTLHQSFGMGEGHLWHIHDMTVMPEYRKQGIAKALLNAFFTDFTDIQEISLVSINDQSHTFWGRYGFVEIDCDEKVLASYGQVNPKYMALFV